MRKLILTIPGLLISLLISFPSVSEEVFNAAFPCGRVPAEADTDENFKFHVDDLKQYSIIDFDFNNDTVLNEPSEQEYESVLEQFSSAIRSLSGYDMIMQSPEYVPPPLPPRPPQPPSTTLLYPGADVVVGAVEAVRPTVSAVGIIGSAINNSINPGTTAVPMAGSPPIKETIVTAKIDPKMEARSFVDGYDFDSLKVPLIDTTKTVEVPKCGHENESGDDYDYGTNNCHSFANRGVQSNPANVGIVRCEGYNNSDVGGHTFNYTASKNSDGSTNYTFYNYSQTCIAKTYPYIPHMFTNTKGVLDGEKQLFGCLRKFCGNDHADGAYIMAPGQLTEIPGYAACVRETLGNNTSQSTSLNNVNFSSFNDVFHYRNRCENCCKTRGGVIKNWVVRRDANELSAYRQCRTYINRCTEICNGVFDIKNPR